MPKAGSYDKSKRKRSYGKCGSNSSDKLSTSETKEDHSNEETVLNSEKLIQLDEANPKSNKPKSGSKSSKCSAKKRRKKSESLSTKSFPLLKNSPNELRVKKNTSCYDLHNVSRVISPSANSLKLGNEIEILLTKLDKKASALTMPLKIKIENKDKRRSLEDNMYLENQQNDSHQPKDDTKSIKNGSNKKTTESKDEIKSKQSKEGKINLSQKSGSKRKNSDRMSCETKRKRSSKKSSTVCKSELKKSTNGSRTKLNREQVEWMSELSSPTDKSLSDSWTNSSKSTSKKSALSFWELSNLQQSSEDMLKTREERTKKYVAEQSMMTKDGVIDDCGGLTLNVLYSNLEENPASEQLEEEPEPIEENWGFSIFNNIFSWFSNWNNSH